MEVAAEERAKEDEAAAKKVKYPERLAALVMLVKERDRLQKEEMERLKGKASKDAKDEAQLKRLEFLMQDRTKNTKPAETPREKELGSDSCQESIEISRLHPSPSSTCQKLPQSPLPCHSSSGPCTPSRNVSNTSVLFENPLSSSTPGEYYCPSYY